MPASNEPRAGAAPPARPVRVCFVIDDLGLGGTETQLLNLIKHLDRSRVAPYLCLLRTEDALSRALEPADCPVLRLEVRSLRHPSSVAAAWRFARFLRRERIDILQAYFPDSTYFAVPVAWLAGVRRIVRTRNNLGHAQRPLDRRIGRLLRRVTTRTVANCEACRESVIAEERLDPDDVTVIYNGIQLDRFEGVPEVGAGAAGRPRRVGMVANVRPIKDPESFVRAAAAVARSFPDVEFVIAGDGESTEAVRSLAASLGLGQRFRVAGTVGDIPAFLASLDVAVLCSLSEGLSNAVLEYMAAGRPIVATAVGETPRLIDDGVTGLLVPPGQPARLAERIERLLRDPAEARRMGAAARQAVRRRFDASRPARHFEELWRAMMPDDPAPDHAAEAAVPRTFTPAPAGPRAAGDARQPC